MELTLGGLFSGRGGFECAARGLGINVLYTCETDTFLRNKLRRLFPQTKEHYGDINSIATLPYTDIVTAGFPCQDISISCSQDRKGIFGHRSGLWFEIERLVKEAKPLYLVLENSPELLKQGFEHVLSGLSESGYDAEWDCWRAADFGYPHNRRRLYVIAYSRSIGREQGRSILQPPGAFELSRPWSPTEAYLRVLYGRAGAPGYPDAILLGDVVPNFRREIHAFGNAVMPVVAEHLFQCIINHLNRIRLRE